MTKIWAEFCSWILQFGEGVAQLLGVLEAVGHPVGIFPLLLRASEYWVLANWA